MADKLCPFCQNKLKRISGKEATELLVPKSSPVSMMIEAGADKARGQWFGCLNDDCGYVAVFRKPPTL